MPEDLLKKLVEMVTEEEIVLSDDPAHLMNKANLVEALKSNSYSESEVRALFRKGFVLPVDQEKGENVYHAGICLSFLDFQKKLEIMGLPLKLQRKIAEKYYDLYWELITDIEYEINTFKEIEGHHPSKPELAWLRLCSELATARIIGEMEERIIKLDPEDDRELQQLISEVAQQRQTLSRKATFGYQENEVKKLIREIWRPPFLLYQGREIKAFINKDSIFLDDKEKRLFWGGHFDFTLCDENGYVRLVVEYHGKGHYGVSEEQKQEALARDDAKKSICVKAGFPIVVLTAEFALLDDYKKIFRKFLRIFKEKQTNIDFKYLCDAIGELLNSTDAKQTLAMLSKMGQSGVDNAFHRLRIYEIQKRTDLLFALLWELYTIVEDFAKLNSVLDSLERTAES